MNSRFHADPSTSAAEAGRLARARRAAGRKLGFMIHATVFVLVNLALTAINLATSHASSGHSGLWAHWPLLGWGVGLAIHGLLALGPVEPVYRRLLERELRRKDGQG